MWSHSLPIGPKHSEHILKLQYTSINLMLKDETLTIYPVTKYIPVYFLVVDVILWEWLCFCIYNNKPFNIYYSCFLIIKHDETLVQIKCTFHNDMWSDELKFKDKKKKTWFVLLWTLFLFKYQQHQQITWLPSVFDYNICLKQIYWTTGTSGSATDLFWAQVSVSDLPLSQKQQSHHHYHRSHHHCPNHLIPPLVCALSFSAPLLPLSCPIVS